MIYRPICLRGFSLGLHLFSVATFLAPKQFCLAFAIQGDGPEGGEACLIGRKSMIITDHSRWYALHTMSNCEARVANYLRAFDVEAFLPDYPTRRQWNDRVKTIRCPLFPGYLFGRWQKKLSHEALGAPGLAHIVAVAGVPVPIPEDEIDSVRRLVDSGLTVCGCAMLKAGQRVRMRSGPLKGLEGRLERVKNHFRLVVSVELLSRSIATEVDAEAIEVLSQNRFFP
ncbi:MAG TPA: transcription termination/antitermination NusG family protein [Bryobacteraceae bacterium]|jgi:transcriptional antiterminator NusG|nr:transcription termination/antitermination NusG family protein [Bryobacteraceae bacterium]